MSIQTIVRTTLAASVIGFAAHTLCGYGALAFQSSAIGEWSPVYTLRPLGVLVVPVHMHVLPDGRVLIWDWDAGAMTTNTWIWNPADGEPAPGGEITNLQHVPNNHTELFCSGHAFMRDGRLLVAGGGDHSAQEIAHTDIFDWRTSTWSPGPDMPVVRTGPYPNYPYNKSGRWYPTVTALPNGELLIAAGDVGGQTNQTPIVFQRNGAFRSLLPGNVPAAAPWPKWYPFNFVAPTVDGSVRVFRSGGSDNMAASYATGLLNPIDGAWTPISSARPTRYYSSAVMWEPGKVLQMGGGAATGECANPTSTTAAAEFIDIQPGHAAQWSPSTSMQYAREYHNATILADGKVLVTGGMNESGGVLAAEMWNPTTGLWSTMASAARVRGYHSSAVLLKDGRVISGGTRPASTSTPCDQPNIEIYSPPYLFNGPRPIITGWPDRILYNTPFTLTTSTNTAEIEDVTMVRLSSTTHSFNENQRFNRLPFTRLSATELSITTPSPDAAPPGHYMVFIFRNGVPSVAQILRLVDPDPTGYVDFPAQGQTIGVGQNFQVAGWAIDLESTTGPGVDTIHVYAYKDFVTPVWLGAATYGGARSDVAGIYGPQFLNSGFDLTANITTPGTYLLAVFPRSTINGQFTAAMTRVIYVQ